MVDYVMGRLDAQEMKPVNLHVAFCDSCFDDFLALLGPDKVRRMLDGEKVIQAETELVPEKAPWRKWVDRAALSVVTLGREYGPGVIVGHLRMLAAGPVSAMRGAPTSKERTTVAEVSVGDNVYGVVLSRSEASLLLDFAGYKTPKLVPVEIVLCSQDGDSLLSVISDAYGNAHLVLNDLPTGRIVVVLVIDEEAWEAFSIDRDGSDAPST